MSISKSEQEHGNKELVTDVAGQSVDFVGLKRGLPFISSVKDGGKFGSVRERVRKKGLT